MLSTPTTDTAVVSRSPERLGALAAGTGALLMAGLAIPANALVLVPLQGSGPAPAEVVVRAAATALVVVAVLDVVVAWGLWLVLRRSAPELALLAAWCRTGYAAVLAMAAPALLLPYGAGDASAEQVRAAGRAFADAWQAGLVLFAVHLVVVGAVVLRGAVVPRWVGGLLLVAGAAYAADGLTHLLLGPGGPLETLLAVVLTLSSGVGELALAVWLLARGGRQSGRDSGRDRPSSTGARAVDAADVAT